MATYHSRSTGEEDGVDDNRNLNASQSHHTHHPYKYSTIFSNKLIDLAISADDAEVAENQRQTALSTTSTSEEIGVPVSIPTFVTEEPYRNEDMEAEDVNNELEDERTLEAKSVGIFLQNGKGVGSSKSKVEDSSCELITGNMSKSDRKEAQESSTNGIHGRTTTNGHQGSSECNLLTVFSSPCQEYFSGSKKSNTVKNELPEYVRIMMEKDLALRRIVKTGSVTISQVEEDVRSEDDEKYSEDDDSLYDDYGEESEGNHLELGRPYAPMGNIDDWDDFPFAKRLLELAHMSLSVSSNSSSPARSDSIYSSTLTQRTLPNETQKTKVSITKKDKKVKTISSISAGTVRRITPKRPFKIEPQHEVPVTSLLISRNRPVPSPPPLPHIMETVEKEGTMDSNKKRKLQRKKKAITPLDTPGSDGEDPLSSFQVDPMKFLEVSLQEGQLESKTIPDDSHRRKYKCNFCEKKFCWSTDLKRHILIHTGERPFKCTECPANFTRKFLMQKHLKKVHQTPAGQSNSNGVPKSTSFLKVPPRLHTTDEEESGSGSGDLLYSEDTKGYSFGQIELKAEEEDYYKDHEMEEGRSDEELDTKIRTNGFSSAEGRRGKNITYLDF